MVRTYRGQRWADSMAVLTLASQINSAYVAGKTIKEIAYDKRMGYAHTNNFHRIHRWASRSQAHRSVLLSMNSMVAMLRIIGAA